MIKRFARWLIGDPEFKFKPYQLIAHVFLWILALILVCNLLATVISFFFGVK